MNNIKASALELKTDCYAADMKQYYVYIYLLHMLFVIKCSAHLATFTFVSCNIHLHVSILYLSMVIHNIFVWNTGSNV